MRKGRDPNFNTEHAEEWAAARQLERVVCWQRIPGMRYICLHPKVVGAVPSTTFLSTRVLDDGNLENPDFPADAWLDLNDPCSLGGLLDEVRTRYGTRHVHAEFNTTTRGGEWWVVRAHHTILGGVSRDMLGRGQTEGLALARAYLAAPTLPGIRA